MQDMALNLGNGLFVKFGLLERQEEDIAGRENKSGENIS